MRYPGGKGQAGVYQKIISLMPPHDVYVELFAGGGNVLERKRPASCSIALDADERAVGALRRRPWPTSTTIERGDALVWLRVFNQGLSFPRQSVLIYADPPYLPETLKSPQRYRCRFTRAQHVELLDLVKAAPAFVMLSGYRSALYDIALADWNRVDFEVTTRGHSRAVESVWCNFQPPASLHDYSYLGGDFRERERIKRKRARWRRRFAALPAHERAAMMEVILELASPAVARPAAIAGNDAAGSRRAVSGDAVRIATAGDVYGARA